MTFNDPIDNFPCHLVYDQTPVSRSLDPEERVYNYPSTKNRSVNKEQRFEKGPALIHKLGHYGCCVTNFAAAYEFYTTHFNFIASDLVYDPETGKDITTFLRLDRGKEQVDHHCFFFFEGPEYHVHHSSYEVHDFDTQGLGHQWLRDKGYELVWGKSFSISRILKEETNILFIGVGRHVLGSQIFDYWWDTSKFMVEHYVDGDLVNHEAATTRSAAGPDGLHIWGPPLPATFLK